MAEKNSNPDCQSREKDETASCRPSNANKDELNQNMPDADDGIHDSATQSECVVCLQKYHHPVKLPCGHIFCFLCVKGVAARSQRCALCRADVPSNYFDHPVLVNFNTQPTLENATRPTQLDKKNDPAICKWFYEGRNGWWQYEERASIQLEEAFQNGEQSTELVIAGFSYIVDIGDMVQYRKNYPTRRRRIKRDKASADKKGIAGLKFVTPKQNTEGTASGIKEEESELTNSKDIEKQVDSVTKQLNNL